MIYIKFMAITDLLESAESKWMKHFSEVRETVQDDVRSGCPVNISMERNVSQVV